MFARLRTIYIDMDGVLAKWRKGGDPHRRGYFLSCEPERKIIDLIHLMENGGYHVVILSSVFQNGYAEMEKRIWLNANCIHADFVAVPYGANKSDYIREPGLLLDDYSENLHDWVKRGYHAVKYYNGINGNNHTWHGRGISYRMNPLQMYYSLIDEMQYA